MSRSEKVKLILKMIISFPVMFILFPVATYYEINDQKLPEWINQIGNGWGKFLEGRE